MSATYLCPSCQGRGNEAVYSNSGGSRDIISSQPCMTCAGIGSIGAPERMPVGFRCPFCGTAHAPQGDCHAGADIACCGEVGHCELIYKDDDDNF